METIADYGYVIFTSGNDQKDHILTYTRCAQRVVKDGQGRGDRRLIRFPKMSVKYLTILLILATLVACGGSGTDYEPQEPESSSRPPSAPVYNRCDVC